MPHLTPMTPRDGLCGLLRLLAAGLALAVTTTVTTAASAAMAPAQLAGSGEVLRQRYTALHDRLERNAFGKPIDIASEEGERNVRGHIHAEVHDPFPRLSQALARPTEWCSILILPVNTKGCTATVTGDQLSVFVGKKAAMLPEQAYRIDFRFRVAARTPQYLRLELDAAKGPMGTRDYHIILEATPIDERRSFLHLAYDTGYGTMTKMAMQAYLATLGADKVGFSLVDEGGRQALVKGMRGVVERNTMRFYLAIEAYLDSLDAPAADQDRKRLVDWFSASMRYPRQLEEMTLQEYLKLKLQEVRRMRAGVETWFG